MVTSSQCRDKAIIIVYYLDAIEGRCDDAIKYDDVTIDTELNGPHSGDFGCILYMPKIHGNPITKRP